MSKGRRPRCWRCRKRKTMTGWTCCRHCYPHQVRLDQFWQHLTGDLISMYERETGNIHVARSEGWRNWLQTKGLIDPQAVQAVLDLE